MGASDESFAAVGHSYGFPKTMKCDMNLRIGKWTRVSPYLPEVLAFVEKRN